MQDNGSTPKMHGAVARADVVCTGHTILNSINELTQDVVATKEDMNTHLQAFKVSGVARCADFSMCKVRKRLQCRHRRRMGGGRGGGGHDLLSLLPVRCWMLCLGGGGSV